VIRGLESISQIFHFNEKEKRFDVFNLPIEINDRPRFAYRGLMIDTGRHYINTQIIKELIDGMMSSKFNVLHWHIIDDEYFTYRSDKIVYEEQYSYSKSELKEIIQYALYRGVTIIPEIDHPSHAKSWILKDGDNITISGKDNGTLNPILDKTYETVIGLINEINETFNSKITHLGGDEVNSYLWKNPEIKMFMLKHFLFTIYDLENYFFNLIRKKLDKENDYIYWVDENSKIFDIYNQNSILMYWGKIAIVESFLSKLKTPKNIIMTPNDVLYLDCGYGNKYGNSSWCGELKTWKMIYNIDYKDSYDNGNVLGYQATLFGELADNNSIIGKIFPRTVSLAERLWNSSTQLDVKSMYVRLIYHGRRMNERGIHSISITTQFCENNIDNCIDNINN
jgi:hexosaminidase